jgi:hypothetical protein
MTDDLEAPASAEELYLARGTGISQARPLMTGDVVRRVDIPGVEVEGDAIILQHPCSMRKDGVNLVDRLLAARVTASDDVPFDRWPTGYFGRMPLPELYGEGNHASASFDDIGLVSASVIEGAERIASLGRNGINLLQQRFVFYLTRFAVPTFQLDRVAAAVFEEADLLEEWTMAALSRGLDPREAAHEFHEWIRADDGTGVIRQRRLAEPQGLSAVRRALRRELERLTGSQSS